MIDRQLFTIARETGKDCGFGIDVKEENGVVIAKTNVPHETPWTLKKGNGNEVKTFLDGMKKGCKSMHFTSTEKGTKRLIGDIETLVNRVSSGDMVDPMYDGIVGMHRTLQQNFWRLIGNVCGKYTNAPFDARNEGAVNFCKVVKEATSNISMPVI